MRIPNPEIEKRIRKECLNLLLEKEPEVIGMREIALACGVSSTTIYYYYKDKESLFEAVKLDCIGSMDRYIAEKTAGCSDSVSRLPGALTAFRDWSFENPRIALLVMGRIKANTQASSEELSNYYRSTRLGKELLDEAVLEGFARSRDTLMDSSLCIAAVWGAIESVLLFRTVPEYWNSGVVFTDRMIEWCCSVIFIVKEK